MTKNFGKLCGWREIQTTTRLNNRASSPFQARIDVFYTGDWKRIELEVHHFETTVWVQLYIRTFLKNRRRSRIPYPVVAGFSQLHQAHVRKHVITLRRRKIFFVIFSLINRKCTGIKLSLIKVFTISCRRSPQSPNLDSEGENNERTKLFRQWPGNDQLVNYSTKATVIAILFYKQ